MININVVPKVGETTKELEIIKPFLEDKLEIQLLSSDFSDITKKTEEILKYKKLSLLIIHLPMAYTDWEITLLDDNIRSNFFHYVSKCCEFSKKYNVEIKILGHLNLRYEALLKTSLKDHFGFLIRMTNGYNVGFLIENPTTEPYKAKNPLGEPFIRFVRDFNHEKIKCCFDLCHYNITKSLLGDRYSTPTDLANYVFSVHFSYFPMNKHVFEENTHGIKHPDKESILKDLKTLQKLGIDLSKAYIVTEINETDYINKPDLLTELNNFKELICESEAMLG